MDKNQPAASAPGFPEAGNYPPAPPPYVPVYGQPPPVTVVVPPSSSQYPPQFHGGYPQPQGPLDYLAMIDQLIIKQEIHDSDVIANVTSNVKFDLLNTQSQLVYQAEEENGECNRNCCGSARSFIIHIRDIQGTEIVRISRACRCCSCCFPCWCLQEMTIESPPGIVIGTMNEEWSFCSQKFNLKDERENKLFSIIGQISCIGNKTAHTGEDLSFDITDLNTHHEVGRITKQWAGVLQEQFSNASNYIVQFNQQLEVQHKLRFIAAVFLLNFMYFEETPEQHRRRDSNDHTHCDRPVINSGISRPPSSPPRPPSTPPQTSMQSVTTTTYFD